MPNPSNHPAKRSTILCFGRSRRVTTHRRDLRVHSPAWELVPVRAMTPSRGLNFSLLLGIWISWRRRCTLAFAAGSDWFQIHFGSLSETYQTLAFPGAALVVPVLPGPRIPVPLLLPTWCHLPQVSLRHCCCTSLISPASVLSCLPWDWGKVSSWLWHGS